MTNKLTISGQDALGNGLWYLQHSDGSPCLVPSKGSYSVIVFNSKANAEAYVGKNKIAFPIKHVSFRKLEAAVRAWGEHCKYITFPFGAEKYGHQLIVIEDILAAFDEQNQRPANDGQNRVFEE